MLYVTNFPMFYFEKVEKLWELLCPLLRTALSNMTVETYNDWGTCIATSCVSSAFCLSPLWVTVISNCVSLCSPWNLDSLFMPFVVVHN